MLTVTTELTHTAKGETETLNVTAPVSKSPDGKQLETSVLSYLQSGEEFSWCRCWSSRSRKCRDVLQTFKYQPVMMWEQFANNLYVNIWSFLPCTRPQKLWMKQDFDAE